MKIRTWHTFSLSTVKEKTVTKPASSFDLVLLSVTPWTLEVDLLV